MKRFIIAAVILASCSSPSESPQLGSLRSEVVAGRQLNAGAGQSIQAPSVNEVFRNPLTGRLENRAPKLWERILLPPLAYAQQSLSRTTVPGALSCVGEEQLIIVPVQRCIVSDQQGRSRIDWLPTTKAGTHRVLINARQGTEITAPDTVMITVLPGPADPGFRSGQLPLACSPATLPADAVRDQYGNAIPFRIVSDRRLTAQDTVVGSLAARTAVLVAGDDAFRSAELRGEGGQLVGRLTYRIISSGCAGQPQVDWSTAGINVQ